MKENLIMSTPMPSCMDHYMTRYMPSQQQQQQQPSINCNSQSFYGSNVGPTPAQHAYMSGIGCYPNSNGWTGIPLISTAQRRPRRGHIGGIGNGVPIPLSRTQSLGGFDEQSISRLAMHAQGAPLISTGRFNSNRKPQQKKDALRTLSLNEDRVYYNTNVNHSNGGNIGPGNDLSSGHSDENTQHANTNVNDTCLPRIIKPRKRRKKDRRPNPAPTQEGNNDCNISNVNVSHQHINGGMHSEGGPQYIINKNINSNIINEINNRHSPPNQQYHVVINDLLPPMMTGPMSTHTSSTAFNNDNNVNNVNGSNSSSCSCKVCDPFGKIWSTPLKRSCSDNSADVDEFRKTTKDVGVIGGDRLTSVRNEWRSVPHSLDYTFLNCSNNNNSELNRKNSLSDSGDSGCIADILSGLNIAEDLLTVGRDLFTTTTTTPTETRLEFQFPSFDTGNYVLTNVHNNNNNNEIINQNYNHLQQHNLNNNNNQQNLNDLTRKLSETLDLKSDGLSSSDSGSVLSDSVFSDGVPDLFVNFDSISKNQLFSASNISKLSNLLFDDNLASPALVMPSSQHNQQHSMKYYSENNANNNNNNPHLNMYNNNSVGHYNTYINNNKNNNNHNNIGYDQPFIFIPDKDRSSEILNCFDMVWNGIQHS